MNRYILLLLCLFSASVQAKKLIPLMREVNKEIDFQTDLPSSWQELEIDVSNFNEAIQVHLNHVVEVLQKRDVSQLDPSAKLQRAWLLNVLSDYSKAGKFPQNTQWSFQTPIFIDAQNTHCAVGYLMQQSGFEALAKTISESQNLAYVREINVEGVSDWASMHGFTVDELAWIQPGYPPNTTVTPLLGGMDGTVYTITEYQATLYAAGDFSTADGQAASNIAAYLSGFAGWLWVEVDGGTNGPVHSMINFENDLIAAGNFSMAGNQTCLSVARLNNGVWQPMGEGLSGTVFSLVIHNGQLFALGDFDIIGSDTNGKDVALWNGSGWDDVGLGTNGSVYSACSIGNELVIGGDFSSCGNQDQLNIASWNGTSITSLGNGSLSPVYELINWNGTITAGGNIKSGSDILGITQFISNSWVSLPGMSDIALVDSTAQFRSFTLMNNELIVGGKFMIEQFMIFGRGLAKWSNASAMPEPLAVIDSTVYACADIGGLYIGGDFHYSWSEPINAIAQVDGFVTSTGPGYTKEKLGWTAYPNPTSGKTYIQGIPANSRVSIYDLQGRKIEEQLVETDFSINITQKGIFIIQVDGRAPIRVIKE